MYKEEINTICNVFVAFSTYLGVGGALIYYIKEILGYGINSLIILLVVYLILGILLFVGIRREVVKNDKCKMD
ncbi:hypothetical protein J4223_02315 [Candidatus Woesearchaeota archaeon]|nr:hypothetical protein [Candidatus Woesearchaeota archaeon]